jgi:putative Mn2+ efflux pump MntP
MVLASVDRVAGIHRTVDGAGVLSHQQMPIKLILLVLPLSLDTFAVSAALGTSGLTARERWRLSLLMAGFEAAMPIVGFLAGGLIGGALGDVADYAAAAVLVAVGIWMLRDDDAPSAATLRRMRGLAAVGIGVSVSVDELAIGLVIGLLGLPALLVAALIGAQALVASQLGVRLGARLGLELGEWAERAAGVLLVAIGVGLGVLRATGHAV